jgi:hypothetical protein
MGELSGAELVIWVTCVIDILVIVWVVWLTLDWEEVNSDDYEEFLDWKKKEVK